VEWPLWWQDRSVNSIIVNLRSRSLRTHDNNLLSHWGLDHLYTEHSVPFLSPLTIGWSYCGNILARLYKKSLRLRLIFNRGQSASLSGYQPLVQSPLTIYSLQTNTCFPSSCGAPSVTRGRVGCLSVQLLLGLASALTVGSKFHRTWDHILLSVWGYSPIL
jgi:hypothetical protein